MNRVVLTGNGLSVGLNPDFSLRSITERFFHRLSEEHRHFIEHHMQGEYKQIDFEEAIASIEAAHDVLKHYNDFLSGNDGNRFMTSYGLNNANIQDHINAIQNIIYEYTASILELIDGNVKKEHIESKLNGFTNWLIEYIDTSSSINLFTLNFDLLLETILLTYYNKEKFADFHYRGKKWGAIDNDHRYNFGPDRSKQIHPNNYDSNIKLHHLHGSLSSFKDLSDGRLFKITTEALRNNDIYQDIFKLNIVPSIVTGGGKSLKVQQEPFSFYYNEFKRNMVIDEYMCDELYIIGYSFRDDHINNAIKERMKASRRSKDQKPLKIRIVDYAVTLEDKKTFVERINTNLSLPKKHKFTTDDYRISFEGANGVQYV